MVRHAAALGLPATPDEVWALIADPALLPRWWPGLEAVDDHGRGLVPGARWHLRGRERPRLFRSPEPTGELIVLRTERPTFVAWQLTGDGLGVELRLTEREDRSSEAVLTVEGPPLVGLRRSLPRNALARLRTLCRPEALPS